MMKMLNPDASKRLNMKEVMEHPWTTGPTATYEEVVEEFKVRHQRNQEAAEAARKEKEEARRTTTGKRYARRGAGDEEVELDHEAEAQWELPVYKKGAALQTEFFSFDQPDLLWNDLLKYIGKTKTEKDKEGKEKILRQVAISQPKENQYKAVLTVTEESNQQQLTTKIKVSLAAVAGADERTTCVSFQRVEGSRIRSNEFFKECREAFAECLQ